MREPVKKAGSLFLFILRAIAAYTFKIKRSLGDEMSVPLENAVLYPLGQNALNIEHSTALYAQQMTMAVGACVKALGGVVNMYLSEHSHLRQQI